MLKTILSTFFMINVKVILKIENKANSKILNLDSS